jgi:hypothetical protein
MSFFRRKLVKIAEIVIITLVFETGASLFPPKIGKIAENCDLNFDPRKKTAKR